MKKDFKGISFIMICIIMFLAACSSTTSGEDDGEYKLGFTVPTLNNPYFVDMQKGAEQAAEDHGVKVDLVGGDNDVSKQVKQVDDFVQRQVDALIIQTVDTSGIGSSIVEANEADIPVLTTGETPDNGEIEVSIAFDN